MKILMIKKDRKVKIKDLGIRLKILWSRNKNHLRKLPIIKSLMVQIKRISQEENEY